MATKKASTMVKKAPAKKAVAKKAPAKKAVAKKAPAKKAVAKKAVAKKAPAKKAPAFFIIGFGKICLIIMRKNLGLAFVNIGDTG